MLYSTSFLNLYHTKGQEKSDLDYLKAINKNIQFYIFRIFALGILLSRLMVSHGELYQKSTQFIFIALVIVFILQTSIAITSLFSSLNKVSYKNPIDNKAIKQSTIFLTLSVLLYFSLLASTIINKPNLAILIVLTPIIFFGIYYLIQKYQQLFYFNY